MFSKFEFNWNAMMMTCNNQNICNIIIKFSLMSFNNLSIVGKIYGMVGYGQRWWDYQFNGNKPTLMALHYKNLGYLCFELLKYNLITNDTVSVNTTIDIDNGIYLGVSRNN